MNRLETMVSMMALLALALLALHGVVGPAAAEKEARNKDGLERYFINPDTLPMPHENHYTHVVTARGGTTVYVSGQYSEDMKGNLVGKGDIAVQAKQTFANLVKALAAAGATPADVVKIQIFVKNYNPRTDLDPVMKSLHETFPGKFTPASTFLGVQSLAMEDMRIEVECIAVVDK